MIKAVYKALYSDIDYLTLAIECGVATASLKVDETAGFNPNRKTLIVIGSQEAINTLSDNLDFGPDESSPINNL